MSALIPYLPVMFHGLLITLLVTVLGSALAVATAFAAGLAKLSQHWFVRWPVSTFVEVFRGTSMLVQMFWLFYVLPKFGISLSPLLAGVLALGLNEGAYASEVVRGAIVTRTAGQNEACVALGMGRALRMRRVLLPQSIPTMIPPLGNMLVDLLKNTSLVSLVTVADLTFQAQNFRTTTGKTTAIYLTILVVYFILSIVLSLLVKWLERRFAVQRVARPRRRIPNLLSKGGARA